MKKTLAMFVMLAIAFSLIACGGTASSSSAGSASSASGSALTGQTLNVMLSEEPSSEDSLTNTLNAWAEATGNTVNLMVIPYDDQLTKFPLMAKNNDLPDLVATTRLTRLYPDEFMDLSSVLDTSLFEEKALQIISQDYSGTKTACAPLQFTITCVYYNETAFAAAGIEVPTVDSPWSLEELVANAEKLMSADGVKYGIAMDASRARYDNLMYLGGGSMVEKDGDSFKVSINSPENISTLETFIGWNDSGLMPKAIWAGGTTDNPADYFKNGDVGIYFSGSWNYNTFTNEISAFDFGVMPSPVNGSNTSAILGGSGLAVPENSKNKDLAVSFLKWLYEDEANYQDYLNRDKGLSSLKGLTYAPADEKAAADFEVMQSEVQNVSDLFLVDESSEWRNYLDNEYRDAIKQAVNGDISSTEALGGFATSLAESSSWPLVYEG
ncbi:MAG: ABC transporter substrate-binding protein [Oscillospiraceae bacterium]